MHDGQARTIRTKGDPSLSIESAVSELTVEACISGPIMVTANGFVRTAVLTDSIVHTIDPVTEPGERVIRVRVRETRQGVREHGHEIDRSNNDGAKRLAHPADISGQERPFVS